MLILAGFNIPFSWTDAEKKELFFITLGLAQKITNLMLIDWWCMSDQGKGLSLEGHAGGQRFASYLLPMHQVFEYFVAEFLKEFFVGYPGLDVAIQSPIWLDIEGTEKAKPDIVLRRNGRNEIVLDTKYKDFDKKPKDDDRNQMYIYCDTQGLNLGVLVYATNKPVVYSRPYADLTLQADSISLNGDLDTFRMNCQKFARKYINYLEIDWGTA